MAPELRHHIVRLDMSRREPRGLSPVAALPCSHMAILLKPLIPPTPRCVPKLLLGHMQYDSIDTGSNLDFLLSSCSKKLAATLDEHILR